MCGVDEELRGGEEVKTTLLAASDLEEA